MDYNNAYWPMAQWDLVRCKLSFQWGSHSYAKWRLTPRNYLIWASWMYFPSWSTFVKLLCHLLKHFETSLKFLALPGTAWNTGLIVPLGLYRSILTLCGCIYLRRRHTLLIGTFHLEEAVKEWAFLPSIWWWRKPLSADNQPQAERGVARQHAHSQWAWIVDRDRINLSHCSSI